MMFGSPSCGVGKTFFAMMVTGGIILTRLSVEEKTRLLNDLRAGYIVGHGRTVKKWVLISLPDPSKLENYLPFIRSGYEAAVKTPEPEDGTPGLTSEISAASYFFLRTE